MTRPITRGAFKEEMAEFERRMDAKLDAKLDLFLGALMARFEVIDRRFEVIDRRFEAIDRRFEAIDRRFDTFRDELSVEIARHTSASAEGLRGQVSVLDDKYKGLPPRVARLEAAVFPPVPPARAVRAAPKKRRRKAS